MRRQRFSREQIAEADQRDILGVARELNLKLEKRKNTYKVPGYGGLYITPIITQNIISSWMGWAKGHQ